MLRLLHLILFFSVNTTILRIIFYNFALIHLTQNIHHTQEIRIKLTNVIIKDKIRYCCFF